MSLSSKRPRRPTSRPTAARPSAAPVLVVSAWDPELFGLRSALGSRPALARGLVARAVGIGLVDAAVGAARALDDVRPRAVIFVGTAGTYVRGRRPDLAIGGAVVARRVLLLSTAVLRGEAYLPRSLPATAETQPALRRALARSTGLPTADVACPLGITQTAAAGRRIAQTTGCDVENLEAFAVARAAAAADVPFACLLGVSNVVGPTAHDEWRAFSSRASSAACAAVLAWIAEA